MKVTYIVLVSLILAIGLLVPGCSSKPESVTSETAILELEFSPNPVPCQDDLWSWTVSIRETNGVGVELLSIARSIYNDKRLVTERDVEIDTFPAKAIPANETMSYKGRVPCQSVTHEMYTVTAIDDNGNTIVTTGKLVFQPKQPNTEASAKAILEVGFNPNPVPCQDGFWNWTVSIEETNGVGVELLSIVRSIYNDKNLVSERDVEVDKFPEETIPAYQTLRFNGRVPCQSVTHEMYIVKAKDDNGNTIVATGKLEFQPK